MREELLFKHVFLTQNLILSSLFGRRFPIYCKSHIQNAVGLAAIGEFTITLKGPRDLNSAVSAASSI